MTETIYTGTLLSDDTEVEYEIRSLSVEDREEALALDQEAVEDVGANIYAPYTMEEMVEVLEKGHCYGAFTKGQLIATRIVAAPMIFDPEKHRKFGIPVDERDKIIDLCGIVVAPKFRRKGLAFQMTSRVLEALTEQGWKHAYATVSPSNIASIGYLFSLGFIAVDLQTMYRSEAIRLMCHKVL